MSRREKLQQPLILSLGASNPERENGYRWQVSVGIPIGKGPIQTGLTFYTYTNCEATTLGYFLEQCVVLVPTDEEQKAMKYFSCNDLTPVN